MVDPLSTSSCRGPSRLAIFDVDETLVRCKSMFSYLAFCLRARHGIAEGGDIYAKIRVELEALRRTQSREMVNRAYYRTFAGWPMSEMRTLATDWFEAARIEDPAFFIQATVNQLNAHRLSGDRIVFLSGSAQVILKPVIDALGGGTVLAVELEEVDGLATGEIAGIQTIGVGKRQALECHLDESPGDLTISSAYGDHLSDLPFLEAVGKPCVVTGDAPLEAVARARGWPLIDSSFMPRHSI